MTGSREGSSMDLAELLPILRRRWVTVFGCVVAALALAGAYLVVAPSTYRATAELYVATATPDEATALAQSNSFALARVQSYVDLASAPEVTGPVIQDLGLSMTPAELQSKVRVTAPIGKVLIDVTATDRSPERAAAIANEIAKRLAEYIEKLESKDRDAAPMRLTVINPAEVPTAPVSLSKTLVLLGTLLLGLVGGAALAVAQSRLDTKLRTPDDLDESSPPLLATIGADRHAGREPVAFDADPYGRRSEAFRQLRTTLDFLNLDAPPKVLAITSPTRGDGRSSTALNLAVSLAASGERVCLIEADLRNPSLAATLGLAAEPGLVQAITQRDDPISSFIQKQRKNLIVLVAGGTPPNANQLLSTERVRTIVGQIAAAADYVVIDTSPLLTSSDGAEIGAIADATVVVARCGVTTRTQLERAVATIERVGKHAAGVVLTMVKAGETYGGYGYQEYRPVSSSNGRTKKDATTTRRRRDERATPTGSELETRSTAGSTADDSSSAAPVAAEHASPSDTAPSNPVSSS